MDRNYIIWILECCLLSLDGTTKKEMLEFGAPKGCAEAGIKLFEFLAKKEVNLHG